MSESKRPLPGLKKLLNDAIKKQDRKRRREETTYIVIAGQHRQFERFKAENRGLRAIYLSGPASMANVHGLDRLTTKIACVGTYYERSDYFDLLDMLKRSGFDTDGRTDHWFSVGS